MRGHPWTVGYITRLIRTATSRSQHGGPPRSPDPADAQASATAPWTGTEIGGWWFRVPGVAPFFVRPMAESRIRCVGLGVDAGWPVRYSGVLARLLALMAHSQVDSLHFSNRSLIEGNTVSPVPIGPARSTMARNETVTHNWFVVDAGGHIVGRLATQIATVLMGKHRPDYTPHVDTGDYVVVLNAHRVRFSGKSMAHQSHPQFTKKMLRKTYERYTGSPSGRKWTTAAEVLERAPERILHEAVRRMLPKNKLGRKMLDKLKIYCGDEHPHQAQNPQSFPEYLLPG